MNIGIVGLGKMGLLHAGILNSLDGVKITAIAEKENLIANYVKNSISDVNIYEDYDKMLESEKLDLAYITTPISSHLPVASSCIRNDTNFFIEKPLTKNLEESKTLCTELKKSSLIHSVGYNRRFTDTFSKVKSFLDNKILGDVFDVKSSMYVSNVFSKSSGWRSKKNMSGGGALLDLGSHLVDLLLWYFGSISSVSGEIKSVYSDEVEDFAHMKIEFVNKINAELDTSWSVKGYRLPEINLEIRGTNGNLRVNEDFIKIELINSVPELENTSTTVYKQSLYSGVPIDIGGTEYTKEDMYVVDCVKEKKQSFLNVFEASKTQSVIQSMYEAAENDSKQVVRYLD